MRIAIITCERYADAVPPFLALLRHFWPDCPYPRMLYSETHVGERWCDVVKRCAKEAGDDPVLLMQDDAWITAPVEGSLIEHGLRLMEDSGAGCVRLYPSPGGVDEYGDRYFARIPRGTRGRISLMPAIWNPAYLHEIARQSNWTTGEAGDMENLGTPVSNDMPEPVLAFKRDVRPWPIDIMNAIARGEWDPNAIKLCREHGIPLDRSRRVVQA